MLQQIAQAVTLSQQILLVLSLSAIPLAIQLLIEQELPRYQLPNLQMEIMNHPQRVLPLQLKRLIL